MTIIFLTIAAAIVLLWGGILALLHWIKPIEEKHILSLGGYITVITGLLIFLVVHTALTQQQEALKNTQERLNQELNLFRDKLGEQSGRIMGQLAEKAELTQSEMEVRGQLQTERAEHTRTREDLGRTQKQLSDTRTSLNKETAAHNAYSDSLNTERGIHRATQERLVEEKQQHALTRRDLQTALTSAQQLQQDLQQTRQELKQNRQELDQVRVELTQTRERLTAQKTENERLQTDLKSTQTQLQKTQEQVAANDKQLAQKVAAQQLSLDLLQAAVDSIYEKVLKRPRVTAP